MYDNVHMTANARKVKYVLETMSWVEKCTVYVYSNYAHVITVCVWMSYNHKVTYSDCVQLVGVMYKYSGHESNNCKHVHICNKHRGEDFVPLVINQIISSYKYFEAVANNESTNPAMFKTVFYFLYDLKGLLNDDDADDSPSELYSVLQKFPDYICSKRFDAVVYVAAKNHMLQSTQFNSSV